MSFLGRLLESKDSNKKQKRNPPFDPSSDMAFFAQPSTQYLIAQPALSLQRSQPLIRPFDDVDDFLSSDLELSFASNVSIRSPSRDPTALTPEKDYAEPMDISPVPVPGAPSQDKNNVTKVLNRPRAFTSVSRVFGRDMSNVVSPCPQVPPTTKSSTQSSSKRIQRAALPAEWLTTARAPEITKSSDNISSAPPHTPVSPADDAMDVDSYTVEPAPTIYSFPLAPHSAMPTVTDFNSLFYDTMSPRRSLDSPSGPQQKKRRSLSPEPAHVSEPDVSSSPGLPSSPSQRKLERMSSGPLLSRFTKPTLQGLGNPSSNALKRSRRPALSAMIHPSQAESIQSAGPILTTSENSDPDSLPKALPPVRRAFSALIPPAALTEQSSDESSFDGQETSSPAQAYAKRQQVKTIRRCDGTDDFRPLTGATAMAMLESPSSRFMSAGLPGFGDNEAHGKILRCHRVSEDGLMRIDVGTLNALLDGSYDSQIANYHVIDCRFDYEYTGGHIPGAININTTSAVEELLLGSTLIKPKPSVSGDSNKKTVLVFHCEFSAKRAPTFAKHLRAKDRAMNNHVYPKIHYPEVYILEGGYCQYFKVSALRCQPPGYVSMDDPTHAASRREDLDQFRKAKFGRHKSYAYGDGAGKTALLSQQQQQPKRNTAPSGGPNPLFAAATAARTRRGGAGGGLSTLTEDGNTTAHSDDDTDIGDSPCPPPTKGTVFKGKKISRAPLARAETYGPGRMLY